MEFFGFSTTCMLIEGDEADKKGQVLLDIGA